MDDVTRAGMQEQVVFASLGPDLLAEAKRIAPEIPRYLDLEAIQLTASEAEAKLLLEEAESPLVIFDYEEFTNKEEDFNLRWWDVGPFRLPNYGMNDPSQRLIPFLQTIADLDARCVAISVDTFHLIDKYASLGLFENDAASVVELFKLMGVCVSAFTVQVESPEDWDYLEGIGVSGIMTNDIPEGLARQTLSAKP